MANTWYISDTHLGHDGIRCYCQRPFATPHLMNKYMTEQWNARVQPEDTVFHLGDFASPRDKDPTRYLEKLNGNIILIRGNHDKKQLLEKFPLWVPCASRKIKQFRCLLNHRPWYPKSMRNEKKDPHKDHDESIENPQRYDFFLTGHIHNNYELSGTTKIGRLWTGRSLNLSAELHNYAPVHEDTILKLILIRNRNLRKDIVRGDDSEWLKIKHNQVYTNPNL